MDSPVRLTRSAPPESKSKALLFYDAIDSSAIARSGVLSRIVEAAGDPALPDNITLAEFKTWLTEGNAETETAGQWSFPTFCTVMKVAEALEDGRVDEWVQLAADSIPPESNRHAGKCSPEEASRGLAKLSISLRRRVFAGAADDAECLHEVLDFLPSHDHAAVLEATITDTLTLEAPLRPSLKVAKALPSIPASFLSLNVHDLEPTEPITAGSTTAKQAVTCISRALQHHSGLTSLQLKLPCITSASLKQLAPAIASLTSLQSLLLHSTIGPDSLATLQQTFRSLPQLQRLAISLSSSDTRKRRRGGESAAAPPHCLVPMLSAASALTALDLSTAGGPACSFAATSTLTMPQLRQLALKFSSKHTQSCASVLGALSAPLTSLSMLHTEGLALPADALADVQALLTALASFTELHSLALATPIDAALSSPPPPRKPRTHAILDAVSTGVPTALAALPRLASLTISTDVAAMHHAAPVMATALTQLTALTVTLSSWESKWGDWPALLQQLPQLRLQRLQMALQGTCIGLPGLAAMPAMPQLTALYIGGWVCVASAEDCEALARMTQLRKLHLVGMRLPRRLRADCARGVAALPALTSLLFHSATPEGCISRILDDHVPEGALPVLQQLSLDVWNRFGEKGSSEEEEDDAEDDDDLAMLNTISSAGYLANRLPAVMRLDLSLVDFVDPGPTDEDEVERWLDELEEASDRELEVTQTGELPF